MGDEKKMVKAFNLTDVPTSTLEQFGLKDQHICIGSTLVAPGKEAEVSESELENVRAGLHHLISVGAVALGELPPAYMVAKDRKRPQEPEAPKTEEPKEEPQAKSKKEK